MYGGCAVLFYGNMCLVAVVSLLQEALAEREAYVKRQADEVEDALVQAQAREEEAQVREEEAAAATRDAEALDAHRRKESAAHQRRLRERERELEAAMRRAVAEQTAAEARQRSVRMEAETLEAAARDLTQRQQEFATKVRHRGLWPWPYPPSPPSHFSNRVPRAEGRCKSLNTRKAEKPPRWPRYEPRASKKQSKLLQSMLL